MPLPPDGRRARRRKAYTARAAAAPAVAPGGDRDACRDAAVAVTADFTWVHGDAIPGAVPAPATPSTNTSAASRTSSKRTKAASMEELDCGCKCGAEETLGSSSPRKAAGSSTYVVPDWCRDYVKACGALLAKDVRGEIVSNPETYLPYVKQAWGCSSCVEDAQNKMVEFSKMLAEEVDRRIEEVGSLFHSRRYPCPASSPGIVLAVSR
ncbi:hypothetical protein OF83DRAFT_1080620 [Amylostereum chailletii]|nr:hypothetical protein OF83DRAFT_1080620 [Amylostereum chailletii]